MLTDKEKREKLVGTIKCTRTVRVLAEDIEDIFSSALYGGITYWCPCLQMLGRTDNNIEVSEHLVNGGTIRIWEDVEEGGPRSTWVKHDIKLTDIISGIDMYINGEYQYSDDITRFTDNGLALDCGMIDSTVADAIVQLSIFKEVVYG